MFLSERIHIIDRINEVKGMLSILNLYLEGTYEDSKATTSIISSAKDELNEALLTAKGHYGKWEKIEVLLDEELSDGN